MRPVGVPGPEPPGWKHEQQGPGCSAAAGGLSLPSFGGVTVAEGWLSLCLLFVVVCLPSLALCVFWGDCGWPRPSPAANSFPVVISLGQSLLLVPES